MQVKKIKKGDKVKTIHSPYLRVKKGTIANVSEIREHHRGKDNHLYKLNTKFNQLFWEHEIDLIEEAKSP